MDPNFLVTDIEQGEVVTIINDANNVSKTSDLAAQEQDYVEDILAGGGDSSFEGTSVD